MDSAPIVLKSRDRPRKKRGHDLVTQAQAEAAAKACGMVTLKIDQLKDKARIGKYIEQLGATRIGRSIILAVQSKAEEDVVKIQGFIDQQDGGDICLIMDLYKLKAIYSDLVIRSAQAQMKIKGGDSVVQGAPALLPAFPPGTRVAIQTPQDPENTGAVDTKEPE